MSQPKIQFHFQYITSNIPKHIVDIHETKKKQIPKPTLPIKNHVLFEFCPSVTPVNQIKMESESESEFEFEFEQENGLVDFVIDNHLDMGELYHKEQSEMNIEYNPMNFSLRHYISNK